MRIPTERYLFSFCAFVYVCCAINAFEVLRAGNEFCSYKCKTVTCVGLFTMGGAIDVVKFDPFEAVDDLLARGGNPDPPYFAGPGLGFFQGYSCNEGTTACLLGEQSIVADAKSCDDCLWYTTSNNHLCFDLGD